MKGDTSARVLSALRALRASRAVSRTQSNARVVEVVLGTERSRSPLRGGARRDEDPAALQSASVEVGHCVVDGVERIGARVQCHLALRGKRHEVLQVDVGADKVADEGDLARDD